LRQLTIGLVLAILATANVGSALAQEKGGEDIAGSYDVANQWPKPFVTTPGYIWGSQAGVFAETPNRIFLLSRGELKLPETVPAGFTGAWGFFGTLANRQKAELRNCIVIVDGSGRMIESWTQWDRLFQGGRGPHTVKISPYDPEHHVWVIDDERHQVFKFTNDGKTLVMTLGEAGVQGNDDKHFGRPTDIAWLPDGTFFISDGYINARVAKFDRNGKFLMAWGSKGNGPGELNTAHSIAVDKNRRVYVADRSNRRIQVFDENGKLLDIWPNINSPHHILVSADQRLWVADGVTNKFLQYDLNGKLLYSFGTYGTFAGGVWGVHQFSVDRDGNLYAAESYGGRTQKFTPKAGADRSRLIAPVPLSEKSSN
jgi:sugar lactone lactonase YvrE